MRGILISLGGALATGALLVLALPPANQSYLAWFAIAPVLWATRDRGFVLGFLAATAAVFVAALLSISGLPYTLTGSFASSQGTSAWTFTGFGIFGFAVALVAAVAADRGSRRLPSWALAAVAVLLEACLLFLLPANLGLTQYRNSIMLAVASGGGIWLVSYIVWFVNFEISMPRHRFVWFTWLVLIAYSSYFGNRAIVRRSGPTAAFACVQADDLIEAELIKDQRAASASKPDLVVWPELSGVPLAPGGNPANLRKLSAEPGGSPFVTSYRDDFQPLPHNAAALFSEGQESEPYNKRKLFGGEKNMHTPGDHAVAVPWHGGLLGLAICYDSCFPEAMRETARLPGVTAIALPTIDPESPSDFVAAIHSASTSFRAAEEDVAIVRADGFAYSQIVDAGGRIAAEAKPGDQILRGTARLGGGMTLYKRFGDWFLYVCGALVILGFTRSKPKDDAT